MTETKTNMSDIEARLLKVSERLHAIGTLMISNPKSVPESAAQPIGELLEELSAQVSDIIYDLGDLANVDDPGQANKRG